MFHSKTSKNKSLGKFARGWEVFLEETDLHSVGSSQQVYVVEQSRKLSFII